jgi:hypothetical protein
MSGMIKMVGEEFVVEPDEVVKVVFTDKGVEFVKSCEKRPIEIRVVDEEPCPYCGAGFPNRPKVGDEEGWWWRCYTDNCPVGYYLPEKKLVKLKGTRKRISYDELRRLYPKA